jgi:hypothetical protein
MDRASPIRFHHSDHPAKRSALQAESQPSAARPGMF